MLKPSASVYPENRNSGIQKSVTKDLKKSIKWPLLPYFGSLDILFWIFCYAFLDPTDTVFWIPTGMALGLIIKICLSQEWVGVGRCFIYQNDQENLSNKTKARKFLA